MRQETNFYNINQKEFKGYYVYPDDSSEKRPVILVAHAWMGQDDFAQQKAEALARLGYIGFAVDLYGEGKEVKTEEEAVALMMPLFKDRALLQQRIKGAYEFVRQNPRVDVTKIGAIGFCFGGLAVIELYRSGIDVNGVVSFHGVLSSQISEQKAKTVPIAKDIKGSILILHGHDDPMSSQEDIQHMQRELTDVKADWEMDIYGQTTHAFMNPKAHDPKNGRVYNPKASERAWQRMRNFFEEVIGS